MNLTLKKAIYRLPVLGGLARQSRLLWTRCARRFHSSGTGLDVSSTALALCRKKFAGDRTKTFLHIDPARAVAEQAAAR